LRLTLAPDAAAAAARGARGRAGVAGAGTGGSNSTFFDRVGSLWRNPTLRLAVIGIEYPDVKHNTAISNKAWEDALFSQGTIARRPPAKRLMEAWRTISRKS